MKNGLFFFLPVVIVPENMMGRWEGRSSSWESWDLDVSPYRFEFQICFSCLFYLVNDLCSFVFHPKLFYCCVG